VASGGAPRKLSTVVDAITSVANPEVRRLGALARARERRRQRRYVVEGRRAIAGMLEAGQRPRRVWWDPARFVPPADWPLGEGRVVTPQVLDKVSQQRHAAGVLAEFDLPEPPAIAAERGGLLAVGISDPGNLGTLIRSAAAFAIDQVVCLGGADPYGPKAVQASAGCLPRVRLRTLAEADDPAFPAGGAPLVGLVAQGGDSLAVLAWPCWVGVGGEADGLPPALLARCAQRVTLPMPGGAESLNAGIAGALACFLARGLHRSD